jgi:hypothetical protein
LGCLIGLSAAPLTRDAAQIFSKSGVEGRAWPRPAEPLSNGRLSAQAQLKAKPQCWKVGFEPPADVGRKVIKALDLTADTRMIDAAPDTFKASETPSAPRQWETDAQKLASEGMSLPAGRVGQLVRRQADGGVITQPRDAF